MDAAPLSFTFTSYTLCLPLNHCLSRDLRKQGNVTPPTKNSSICQEKIQPQIHRKYGAVTSSHSQLLCLAFRPGKLNQNYWLNKCAFIALMIHSEVMKRRRKSTLLLIFRLWLTVFQAFGHWGAAEFSAASVHGSDQLHHHGNTEPKSATSTSVVEL